MYDKLLGSKFHDILKWTLFTSSGKTILAVLCLCLPAFFLLRPLLFDNDGDEKFEEHEFFFREELSSVSVDPDQTIWIGTETGDVFLFDQPSGDKRRFDLKGSRVYKVSRDVLPDGDTVLVVGMRNAGLQLWSWPGLTKIRQYRTQEKGSLFTAYDFVRSGDHLYVATSEGFYTARLEGGVEAPDTVNSSPNSMLSPIYEGAAARKVALAAGDSLLFFPVGSGIKAYHIPRQELVDFFDRPATFLTLEGDTVVALNTAASLCYRIRTDPARPAAPPLAVDSTRCDNHPHVYFKDDMGNRWFVAADRITIVNGGDGERKTVDLRREVPIASPNIAAAGPNGFTYLVTDKALWEVSSHLTLFRSQREVLAACKADGDIYFVSSRKELFKLNKGYRKANKIGSLDVPGQIGWLEGDGKHLYFSTRDNVYRYTVPRWDIFGLYHPPVKKMKQRPADITSQGRFIDGVLHVGSRNGLISYSGLKGHATSLTDDYITSISGDLRKAGPPVYITTLNSGAYHYDGARYNKLKPFGGEFVFAQGVAPVNDSLCFLLDNQYITSSLNLSDTVRAKGLARVVTLDDSTLIGFPRGGLATFGLDSNRITSQSSRYNDITFHPNALLFADRDLLFAGTGAGAVLLEASTLDLRHWVDIRLPNRNGLIYLFILIVIILVAIICVFHFKDRKMRDGKILQCKEKLRYLIGKKEKLRAFIPGIPDEITRLSGNKPAPENVDDLLSDIGRTWYAIEDNLIKQLAGQLELIKHHPHKEISERAAKTEKTIDKKNISDMMEVLDENKKRMDEYDYTLVRWEKLHDDFEQYGVVDEIFEPVIEKLASWREQFLSIPVPEANRAIASIEKTAKQIDTPFGKKKVEEHIQWYREANSGTDSRRKIGDWLSIPGNDVWSQLRKIKQAQDMEPFLQRLDSLDASIRDFITIKKKLCEKLNDTEKLKYEVEERELSGRIKGLITEFNNHLSKGDSEIISEICEVPVYDETNQNSLLVVSLAYGKKPEYVKDMLKKSHDLLVEKKRLKEKLREFAKKEHPGNPPLEFLLNSIKF